MWERCWSSLEPGWTPTVTFFLLYLLIQQHVMEIMTTTATRVPAATPRYSPPLQATKTTPIRTSSNVGTDTQNYTCRRVATGRGLSKVSTFKKEGFFKIIIIYIYITPRYSQPLQVTGTTPSLARQNYTRRNVAGRRRRRRGLTHSFFSLKV